MPEFKYNVTKEEAMALFLEHWPGLMAEECVALGDALGRVLSRPQAARQNLPVVRASGMDGVAVASARCPEGRPQGAESWQLGKDFVRADTGDDFPDEFDAVIPIEKATIGPDGQGLQLDPDVRVEKGMSIRPTGSSVREGQLLIDAPHRLNATDLAVLAMGNIAEVPAYRQPIVAFIPTGTELVRPGGVVPRAANIDSNSFMAKPLLEEFGAKAQMYPIVRDEPLALERMLSRAVETCDLILLNGGSSKGSEDFALRLLGENGKVLFHWTQCGPGRPAALADYQGKPVVVVPGPPYGCLNVLHWLIRPIIAHMIGLPKAPAYTLKATLTESIDGPKSISFLLGANISRNEEGKIEAHLMSFRKYGALTCLTAAGIIHTNPGQAQWKAGDEVEVTLLRPVDI